MESSRISMKRHRALPRSRISLLEQDKENRGRPQIKQGTVINKSSRNGRTLRRRQSVELRVHVGRKDDSKIPVLRPRQRGRRLNVVSKGKAISMASNQTSRNDRKVVVLNEAEIEVDVARETKKEETMMESTPMCQCQDDLPPKVPTNTPTDKAPKACKISEDEMIFLMRQINVDDFFDVTMESDTSLMSSHGYQTDILSYLKDRETLLAIRNESTKSSVEEFHREVLIDWLVDVQCHLELENETLHLAVALIDAFVLKRSISLHYLQLLGITCLFIASKYEEIYVPSLDSLCKLCANCYNEKEFLVMERRILRHLDFDLFFPTAVDFVTRYLILSDIDDERVVNICSYVTDLALPSTNLRPSLWAAAALYFAVTLCQLETRHKSDDSNDDQKYLKVWDWKLQSVTGYSETHLTDLADGMMDAVCAIKSAKYQALYRKYNVKRFGYISEELANRFPHDPTVVV